MAYFLVGHLIDFEIDFSVLPYYLSTTDIQNERVKIRLLQPFQENRRLWTQDQRQLPVERQVLDKTGCNSLHIDSYMPDLVH